MNHIHRKACASRTHFRSLIQSISTLLSAEGEYNLLLKLIEKRNDIVLREELAESEFDETELRKVDVQITRIRQKIENNPKKPHFIQTVRGKGYRLVTD